MKDFASGSPAWNTLAIVLLLMSSCSVLAQAAKTFEVDQLREDFQVARKSLEEGHSGLYRYVEKAGLDRSFDETAKSLDHPMDKFEFYRVLARAIAAIKCGHTNVALPADAREELDRSPHLPFEVKVD